MVKQQLVIPHLSVHLHYSHSHTHLFSEVATFFNFAKASVGSGSFALPWGILQCGVLLGSAGMILLGIVRCVILSMYEEREIEKRERECRR